MVIESNGKQCVVCDEPLIGLQCKYCSNKCKCKVTNRSCQSYDKQQERAQRRRKMIVEYFGGKCPKCGYDKNYAALVFHHKDPSTKSFKLDARHLANSSQKVIEEEVLKCEMLCANCHMELHNPTMMNEWAQR